MGKPHPIELRERAVALVEQGNTHTETARRLCVSIKFVNDMVRLKRETGALKPKPQGNPEHGKLSGLKDWVRSRIAAQADLTIVSAVWSPRAFQFDGWKFHGSRSSMLLLGWPLAIASSVALR